MITPPYSSSIIKATGLVFGDIGTSPIYTLSVLFLLVHPSVENVMGIISMVIWTLIILVTLQYAVLAMRLSHNGEGGTIVLKEILLPMLKDKTGILIVTLLAILGVSLMVGDCVITPAISILSAVEGIHQIPGAQYIDQSVLVFLAIIITIFLFYFQKNGTEKVASAFGPIMVIWFAVLFLTGLYSAILTPEIFLSVSPYYAIHFILHHGYEAFLSLSLVLLCATGGEALFADMGHLGREPIRWAWIFVFFALLFSYFGQGAYMIRNAGVHNPLFEMIYSEISLLYIPFLILMIAATVIASQAVISGIYSIVYQAITTHMLPMLHIDYTSTELRTQIYIDSINWMLCVAVIFVLLIFEYSDKLANAYGIAVTGTMFLTGLLMTTIFHLKRSNKYAIMAGIITLIDFIFLLSMFTKISHGGYWSLIIAAIPFSVFIIYIKGQKALYHAMNPMEWDRFLKRYLKAYQSARHIRGTAIFFARSIDHIPTYITRTMFTNEIIYNDNVIVSINILDKPSGSFFTMSRNIAPGLSHLSIHYGYMEIIDMIRIIREAGIEEKTIFYGMEEIVTKNIFWKIFYIIKRICPSFVQYYRLPSHKVHGVVTRIELR